MVAIATLALVSLALPAQAMGAVTFGSNLNSPPQFTTLADFAFAQRTLSPGNEAAGGTTAPIDGVVVAFRLSTSGSVPFAIRFRLFRGNTSVGRTPVEAVPAVAGIHTFPARIPVAIGDVVGLENPGPGASAHISTSGGTNSFWSPPPFADETRTPNGSSGNQLLVNADIEPDADGDGFGDESQDACPANPGIQVACPAPPETTITKQPKNRTKKKRATFDFTTSEPGSTFECSLDGRPFAPCTPPLTVRVKIGKHSFQVRARTAAGDSDPTEATDTWTRKKAKR